MTTPARAGWAVLLAPGILSPLKIIVKGARCARVAGAMAQAPPLSSDLARQDPGSYQKDGDTWTRLRIVHVYSKYK
jgi:hypothetical protein